MTTKKIFWENWITAAELAEEFGYTSRHIRRLLEKMDVEKLVAMDTDVFTNFKVKVIYKMVKKNE